MTKEAMVISVEEIGRNFKVSDAALEAYKFAVGAGLTQDEGEEADFIVKRNAKSGWRDLWEFKAWCEKTAASIKDAVKHTFNIGTDDQLPSFAKWAKQSYTYDFEEGAGALVVEGLIKKKIVSKEDFFNQLTVSQVAKASGLSVDKIKDLFPDVIVDKAKERTLRIW